jgi:DNA-binding IclR family transcriptional regulator
MRAERRRQVCAGARRSGLLMLALFPADGSFVGNAQVAQMLGMSPSTSHRYMAMLVAAGLLERDRDTRRCRRVIA